MTQRLKDRFRACFAAKIVAIGVAVTGSAVVATDAAAEPSPKDRAVAKGDWTKGKQQMAVKSYGDAAEAFAHADSLDPKAQYKLDLARAQIELGKLVEAETLLEEIAALDEANADKEKAAARSLSEKLVPRIPVLRVAVKGCDSPDVRATIDGEPAEIGVDIRKNPGRYTIDGASEKCTTSEEHASVAEGERFEVNLNFKQSESAKTVGDADEGKASSGGNMWPAAIAFVIGGAGLVTGTVFGVLSLQLTDELAPVCKDNRCPSKYADNVYYAQVYGNTSTGTFIVGGAGIVAGIVLAVTVGRGSSGDPKKPEKGAFVMPYFTGDSAGVAGTF